MFKFFLIFGTLLFLSNNYIGGFYLVCLYFFNKKIVSVVDNVLVHWPHINSVVVFLMKEFCNVAKTMCVVNVGTLPTYTYLA